MHVTGVEGRLLSDTTEYEFTETNYQNSVYTAPLYFGTELQQPTGWETNPSKYRVDTSIGYIATTSTECANCLTQAYDPTASTTMKGDPDSSFVIHDNKYNDVFTGYLAKDICCQAQPDVTDMCLRPSSDSWGFVIITEDH